MKPVYRIVWSTQKHITHWIVPVMAGHLLGDYGKPFYASWYKPQLKGEIKRYKR